MIGIASADVSAPSRSTELDLRPPPGWTVQLASEATTYVADPNADLRDLRLEAGDPVAPLRRFIELFRAIVGEENLAGGAGGAPE